MTNEKDGGPAFPEESASGAKRRGMTLRDYFAAAALTSVFGVIKQPPKEKVGEMRELIAKTCYVMADAMIAARDAK